MPNFDQTGPAGQGALSGKKQGTCVGGGVQNGAGRGAGCCPRKMGRGVGVGNTPMSLDDQEKALEERLQVVRNAKKNNTKK